MTDIGDRMKEYERTFDYKLLSNLPIIIRLDGRGFSKLTSELKKPFDFSFMEFMDRIAIDLCNNEIMNVKMGYIQSDEISLLIYKNPYQSAWFNNRIQKIISIVSARASAYAMRLNNEIRIFRKNTLIMFDSRALVIPKFEVENYFIWRQKDWERNLMQMLIRNFYSQKQLQHKNKEKIQDMLLKKGINWNDLPPYLKKGRCVIPIMITKDDVDKKKWIIDNNIPTFTKDRNYIRTKII